jgi:acyl-coenzyme A thioesterase PaaI-like protein
MKMPSPAPAAARDTERWEAIRERVHPRCVVCSPANPLGLGQAFALQSDGSVESTFAGGEVWESYPGLLHGGVTAALLDGAMTNCLFAHGVEAVTAELRVRYRHPVAACGEMTTRASLVESHGRLHLLRAELRQAGQVKATALGKFLEPHE